MSNKQKEIKEIVEDIISGLKNQGVNVTDAAVLKIKDGEQPEVSDAVDNFLKQMGATQPGNAPDDVTATGRNRCFCPDCFTFDTFEEMLAHEGAIFDYNQVKLDGKVFNVKYYKGKFGQHIMLTEDQPVKSTSVSELQMQLNEAVAAKDFGRAQVILNELNTKKSN